MRHFTLRLAVALLTFVVGMVSAGTWYARRGPSTNPAANVAQQPAEGGDTSGAERPDKECDPAFEGRYSNYDYAFSVQIPNGMIGFGSCHTNHGFGIDLTNPTSRLWLGRVREGVYPQAYLYVDASYNSSGWRSLDESMRASLDYLKAGGGMGVVLVSKARTRLSTLRAIRFVARYNKSGEETVNDVVLAFRKDGDIVSTVDLTTPAARYDKDKETVTEIQRTWHLEPLP